MITCEEYFQLMKENGFDMFTGVPDSTFKHWMKFLADEHGKRLTNLIACNECEAVALAAGYHLATGKFGVAYMQNAGLGKTVNPLTSLADPQVYNIPILLMVGWRGEPGKKDEPQHIKMGRITQKLLDTLEVPYDTLPGDIEEAKKVVAKAKEHLVKNNSSYALVIKKGTFDNYDSKTQTEEESDMTREEAIKTVVENLKGNEVIVSTTGKTSRELFELRTSRGEQPSDFYTVGSMGCSSSIAGGIAIARPAKRVFVFDGDGAAIMQMGAIATIGNYAPENLFHIVFDNAAYDSTGGQPTVSPTVNFEEIAVACGYKGATTLKNKEELTKTVANLKEGPYMIIVKVKKGARKDLGRPTTTPIENKKAFMKKLE